MKIVVLVLSEDFFYCTKALQLQHSNFIVWKSCKKLSVVFLKEIF